MSTQSRVVEARPPGHGAGYGVHRQRGYSAPVSQRPSAQALVREPLVSRLVSCPVLGRRSHAAACPDDPAVPCRCPLRRPALACQSGRHRWPSSSPARARLDTDRDTNPPPWFVGRCPQPAVCCLLDSIASAVP